MKKSMAVVLSIFMFFGVPLPVYALEQLTETQNVAVESQNSPDIEKTEVTINGSVKEEEQLPADIMPIIEESAENAEEINGLSSEVEQEDESSRNEIDIIAEENDVKGLSNITVNEENVTAKTASLTITKKFKDGEVIDPQQRFIFVVENTSNKYRVEIAMQGNSSVTIEGLQYGAYSVQEVIDWSWRYEVSDITIFPKVAGATDEFEDGKFVGKRVALSAAQDDVTMTFFNQKVTDNWLSGDSFAINLYGQASKTDAVVYFREEDDES
ncbi:MAG: hypothetical protein WBI17_12065 [Clostridiaceae bacterium]